MSDDASDHDDQLLRLGQQVLDALVTAYVPAGDDDHALALFPGQAVPDGLVQQGTTNRLQVSQWVGGSYDFAEELVLATGTPLATTLQTGMPLRTAYYTAAKFGVPAVAADAPNRSRLEDLISRAAAAVRDGSNASLSFEVEPADFMEPTCQWYPFDTAVTTHAEQTTTTPPPRRIDPLLWKLRALPPQVADELPGRVATLQRRLAVADQVQEVASRGPAVIRRALLDPEGPAGAKVTPVTSFQVRPDLDLARVAPISSVAAQPAGLTMSARTATLAGRRFTDVADGDTPVLVRPLPSRFVRAVPAEQLATVHLPDLADAPSTTTVTTADSSLHVHFEYLALTIKRQRDGEDWWHPDLVTEHDWYVPLMRAGQLVPAADDEGATTCQPLRLILVRNLSMTGTWTSSASELMQGVHYVGPFLMQLGSTAADASSAQQTVMLGQGTQVIGMVCGPIPPLPPSDDPSLAAVGDPGVVGTFSGAAG